MAVVCLQAEAGGAYGPPALKDCAAHAWNEGTDGVLLVLPCAWILLELPEVQLRSPLFCPVGQAPAPEALCGEGYYEEDVRYL
mgnify:CR=1 FL=1